MSEVVYFKSKRMPVNPELQRLLTDAVDEWDSLPNTRRVSVTAMQKLSLMLGGMTDQSRLIVAKQIQQALKDFDRVTWHPYLSEVALLAAPERHNLETKLSEILATVIVDN